MSTFRKLLLSLLLVSLTGSAFGAGTFATFTASTTNAGSTFATGTVVLQNTTPIDTCFSSGVSAGTILNNNVNAGCAATFSATVKKPGESATADLTLANVGDIEGTLTMGFTGTGLAGICNNENTTATPDFHGDSAATAGLCSGASALQVKLQEFQNSSFDTTAGANYRCLFDLDTNGVAFQAGACDATGGDLNTFDVWTTAAPKSIGTIAGGAARYFRLEFFLPDDVTNNSVQGKKVDFTLTWVLTQ